MLPVIRTGPAQADLEGILTYLEDHSPPAAERLARLIDERCELLGHVPGMGRPRDDLAPGLRSIVVEKYVVFFRATSDAVQVIRILHGSRDIDAIMKSEEQP